MLKTRESRSRIKNDMKRIMEEQLRSPMLSGVRRPLGIGTPAGSGVFNQINDSATNSVGSMGLGRVNKPIDLATKSLVALLPLTHMPPETLAGRADHAHDMQLPPSIPPSVIPQLIIEEELKTEGSSLSLVKNQLS